MAQAAEIHGGGTLVERTRALAPWLVIAAISYPLLVWPYLGAPAPVANADLAPAAPGQLGVLNRVFFPPLLLAGIAVFIPQMRVFGATLLRPTILLTGLFVLWAAATALWSGEPDISFRRSLLQGTIVASVLLPTIAARDPRAVLDRLFWLFALVAGLNLVAVALNPPGPLGHEGIYTHKNLLGGVAAMVFLTAMIQLFSGQGLARLVAAGVALAAIFLLIESRSKTSQGLSLLIPAVAFLVCLVTRSTRISPAIIVPAGVGVLALIYWIGVATYQWDFARAATVFFGDPTLTKRTIIWDFVNTMIERRPWLGYGYEAFWGVSFEAPSIREAPSFVSKLHSGHNGYLDLIVHTGRVGLAIFLVLALAALHAIGRVARYSLSLGYGLMSLMLFCLAYNFLESTFFRGFELQHLVFILVIALAASAHDRIRAQLYG